MQKCVAFLFYLFWWLKLCSLYDENNDDEFEIARYAFSHFILDKIFDLISLFIFYFLI